MKRKDIVVNSKPNLQKEKNTEKHTTKKYAWILAKALPFVIFAVLLVLNKYYLNLSTIEIVAFFVIPSVILCYLDKESLKKQSIAELEDWYIYIPPLYLWKRYQVLNDGKGYAYEWTFGVVLFTGLIMFISNDANALPETACTTVTEIIGEQLDSSISCKRVDIDEEVSDGFYLATAILDNGKKIDIAITRRENRDIYVEIVDGIFGFMDAESSQTAPVEEKIWKRSGDPILSSEELHGRDEVNSGTNGRFGGIEVALSDGVQNNDEDFYDIPTNPNTLPGEEYYEGDEDSGVVEGMGHDYSDPYYKDR